MPVFTRLRDGVLEVIVDGDFTTGELMRAGTKAIESNGLPKPVPVLLDMSGAAGLDAKPEDQLREAGAFFGELGASLGRFAVLGPPAAAMVMEEAAEAAGLQARPFGRKAEAVGWLRAGAQKQA
jgi:hypothetical protein